MSKMNEHPTVIKFRKQQKESTLEKVETILDTKWLQELCLSAGADDVGFVEIERPVLDDQRNDILNVFPQTKTLISIICRMNREPIRSVARSVANLEFHHTGDKVNEITHKIVSALEKKGVRAINPAMGFPMEMDNFPEKGWVISHKPVAIAAGLGEMGLNRMVIHPKFGNFLLLGTIAIDAEVSKTSQAIDYNPCVDCKLCVAACPVGAISSDGHFNFSACYTHNYREFMGGFTDWVETIVESKDALTYRKKVTDSETVSMWQSLSFGPVYKAAYCMGVCPAGEDVIAPFLTDRKAFTKDILTPFQKKEEPVYVLSGSDGEMHLKNKFPHKTIRKVHNGLRPRSIQGFLKGLSLTFQRNVAEKSGLNATYHFTFTGKEEVKATVSIKGKELQIQEGHIEKADLELVADSETWLRFLARESGIVMPLIKRKVKIKKGSPKLLLAFGKCFPS